MQTGQTGAGRTAQSGEYTGFDEVPGVVVDIIGGPEAYVGAIQNLGAHPQMTRMRATISSAKATKAWAPLELGSNTTPGKP